jgi:predicted NAD/FAD-binding protein
VLLDASGLERAILGSIRYQPNEVVLHRDTSLMPSTPRAWSSWNYRIPAEDGSAAIVTYDMNRLQNIQSRHRFLVTLNGSDRIDPRLIDAEFRYDHPVFDEAAIEAQRRHADISGRNRVHFCGAYWGYGFHEDGVVSALKVCRSFGVEL